MNTWQGLDKMLGLVTRIERALRTPGSLKRQLGRTLLEQTKHRLEFEKTAPDGTPWERWSREYAATRGPSHSLLIDSRKLLNSIKASVTKDGASVTSDVEYAMVHQRQRPYLGVSEANAEELSEITHDWMERIL